MKNRTLQIFISYSHLDSKIIREEKQDIQEILETLTHSPFAITRLEGHVSGKHVKFAIEEFFSRKIEDGASIVHFCGYSYLSKGTQSDDSTDERASLNFWTTHDDDENDESFDLAWLNGLAQKYSEAKVLTVLDCRFSKALNENDRNLINQLTEQSITPIILMSTSMGSGRYEKQLLAESPECSNLHRKYVAEYLERYLSKHRNDLHSEDVGISILEGLSLPSLRHQELVSEYYHLSVKSELSEEEEVRIDKILSLAEEDNNFAKLISRVDHLAYQKLGSEVSQDVYDIQIDKTINLINMELYESELSKTEEERKFDDSSIPIITDTDSSQLTNTTESWKIENESSDTVTNKQHTSENISEQPTSINETSSPGINTRRLALEYYSLFVQPKLSEAEEERIDKIISLAEEDDNLAKLLGKVDKLVYQKLGDEVSQDACDIEIEKTIKLIEENSAQIDEVEKPFLELVNNKSLETQHLMLEKLEEPPRNLSVSSSVEGTQQSLQNQSHQRVLAAIVVTDAVGFTAQMSADEERALAIINRDLKQIASLCNVFKGQVLKSTGDGGLLMCFFSAAQAVACALNIQKKLRGDSKRDSFDHRIGIHLGDVYINDSDVMGNGVNIAARLESFAAPGEICVSQVVYDVVKSRLELDATFLGPLNLKNIQESVPAYQLRPEIELDACDAELTRPFFAEGFEGYTFDSPMEQALQTLEDHTDHLRIKKLIFGTCQNLWENDTTVLDQFSLQQLIESLMQRNPSVEHCRASLYRIVATLNHKEVYSDVAEVILQALTPIYIERAANLLPTKVEEEAQSVAGKVEEEAAKARYQQVADELERDAQIIRIKKVLYCLCHKIWETDIQKIEQADTATLVQQLYQLTPTPNDLKFRLRHLLHHLNRKAKYTKIVNIIFQAFHPLYSAQTELIPMSTPGLANANDTDSPETCFGDLPVGIHPENTVAFSTKALEGSSMGDVAQVKDRADLFELRFDIIKYCNPLRAKILLHSTLYSPFTGSSQEWALLRSKTLEDFLREVFNYCSSFQDLESKLSVIVHCLEDAEENEPVAMAILNAIKPYYNNLSSQTAPSAEVSRIDMSAAVTSMRPASYG